MIRTIIIEDEKKISDFLLRKLHEWIPEINVLIPVPRSINPLNQSKNESRFGLNGHSIAWGNAFDIIKELHNPTFELIFITAYDQYAIQAIKLSALDYLLKPIDETELKTALDKATNKIKYKLQNYHLAAFLQNMNLAQPDQKITLASSESVEFINIKDIIRIQGDSNYCHFHLKSASPILVARTLKEYEVILASHKFVRTHLSHLINPLHISKYDKSRNSFVMNDKSSSPLSRVRKKEIFES